MDAGAIKNVKPNNFGLGSDGSGLLMSTDGSDKTPLNRCEDITKSTGVLVAFVRS